jgi:hypothetical protein
MYLYQFLSYLIPCFSQASTLLYGLARYSIFFFWLRLLSLSLLVIVAKIDTLIKVLTSFIRAGPDFIFYRDSYILV